MTSEGAPLTAQQNTVLQRIYEYFHDHGSWPTFIAIDRPLRREHHWNTGAIIQSLPESMIVPPRQGLPPIPADELRLRLPGIQACDGGSEDTERFIRLLRWLAEREESYEPPPGSDAEMPRVTSREVANHLDLDEADQLPLRRLYLMLQLDHWGLGGSGINEDGWYVWLGPDVWRFRDVQTIEDCIGAREAWRAEGRPPIHSVDADSDLQDGQFLTVASPYVDEQVVAEIRAKSGQSKFDVTKLLGLIDELNDDYARRNIYASHALLRAVLDHIPPILGCTDFTAVTNNYSWGRTDKRYMKKLADFRDQADDALHRQISAKPDLLGLDDMPASVCVDRLLQECADLLLWHYGASIVSASAADIGPVRRLKM